MFRRFIRLDFLPRSQDLGLLALRLLVPTSLFLKHGTEKLFGFHAMAAHFPNPLHIGAVLSLTFAMIADGVCMPLLILGLAARWAALWELVNLFVAWAFIHHFQFFGRGADHGELVFVYMGVMLTLFLAGPGKYSIDSRL
jgi:putative oxidoreductase